MRLWPWHVVLVSVLFAGCGDQFTATDRPATDLVQSSSVIFDELLPYSVTGTLELAAHVVFRAHSQDGTIRYTLEDGTQEVDIAVPSAVGILWASTWEVGGTDYFVLCSVDSAGQSTLYRLHDSGSDGLPDASTLTAVADSGANVMHWGHATVPLDDGTVFVLDDRCKDVLTLTDSNQDGWPNSLSATPFARSGDFAELEEVNYIVAMSAEFILASASQRDWMKPGTPMAGAMGLEDDDQDLVADVLTPAASTASPPGIIGRVFDGQVAVAVSSGIAADGKTVEVWELDQDDVDVGLLGSGVLDEVGEKDISLSAALVEGDRVGIRFSGEAATQLTLTAIDGRPQLHSAAPSVLETGVPYTLTIRGVNLTLATIVKMQDGNEGAITDLTVASLTGNEEITVSVSSIASTHTGIANLWAVDPAAPEDSILAIKVDVNVGNLFGISSFTPSSGPVGTTITVTGHGFKRLPVCAVIFGGDATAVVGEFTCISDTELTVQVPVDAQTGTFQVDHSGIRTTSATTFTVTSP